LIQSQQIERLESDPGSQKVIEAALSELSGEYISTLEKLGTWRSNQESQLRGLSQTINNHHEFTTKVGMHNTATVISVSELQARVAVQSNQIKGLEQKLQRQEGEEAWRVEEGITAKDTRPLTSEQESQLGGLSRTVNNHHQFTVKSENSLSSIKALVMRQSDRIEKTEFELQSQCVKLETHARLHDKRIKEWG